MDRCGKMLSYLARHYGWEDLPGELLLHLGQDDWRRLRTWAGRSSLKTWVEQVAVRLCLKRLKENRRFRPLEEWNELEEAVNRDKEDQERQFSRGDLLRAMAKLRNDQERRLIALHALQGLSISEAAERMGISRGNADVVKHRAIGHMREILGLEGGRHAR